MNNTINKVQKPLIGLKNGFLFLGGAIWIVTIAYFFFPEYFIKSEETLKFVQGDNHFNDYLINLSAALFCGLIITLTWNKIEEVFGIIKDAELYQQGEIVKNLFAESKVQVSSINDRMKSLPEEIHDILALDKKIAQLHKELNKNNQLKKELINSIEHFALIHGSENEISNEKIPLHVIELFKTETMKKLTDLNDALVKCKAGELTLEQIDCVSATINCMDNAKNNVFAISFPDIHFWEDQGKSYLDANKRSIINNGVEVCRFFVIRDSTLDRKVIEDDAYAMEFIDTLKEQLAINNGLKKGQKGKMRVFITDIRLLSLNQIQEGLRHVPDISLYDDETVSEWEKRGGFSDQENEIQTSVISYDRKRLTTARKTKQYFMQHAHSLCIEIGNGVSPEQGIVLLKEKLKKAGKM